MRGIYTAEIKTAALATNKSLIVVQVPATKVFELISAHIGDVGTNVTNQQLEAIIFRIATLGSPTGTTITPNPEEVGDQASAATSVLGSIGTDVTTKGVNVDHQGFASLAGYQFAPVPEERPVFAPSTNFGMALVVAPGVAFDAVVQLKWREIG